MGDRSSTLLNAMNRRTLPGRGTALMGGLLAGLLLRPGETDGQAVLSKLGFFAVGPEGRKRRAQGKRSAARGQVGKRISPGRATEKTVAPPGLDN